MDRDRVTSCARNRSRLLGALSTVALLAALFGWLLYLRPPLLGGKTTMVVVSGSSMQPRLDSGDLVVVRNREEYDVGDIVAFRVPDGEVGAGALIIHRVVGGTASAGYRVRGDNKALADLWRPRGEDVLGRLQLRVPEAGTALAILGSPLGAGASAGLLVFFYVLTGGAGLRQSPRPAP